MESEKKGNELLISDQSLAQKMEVLRMTSVQQLGGLWAYYNKIKKEDTSFKLIKEESLVEQMKATRAALKFTSKNTSKTYWTAFKTSTSEVKSKGGVKNVPKLPELEAGADVPQLSPALDAFIITWTPLKFINTIKFIREKGIATERYAEGLVAKLLFKVVGFYADPNNWDADKLGFYFRKLDEESSFTEISQALEPLKKDLQKFVEVYIPFKFAKASLSKDVASEEDSFDDAFDHDTPAEKLKSLYLHHFIYEGMEQFLFGYFSRLCFMVNNPKAILYLTQIFQPAISKAIEVKQMFLGSFEIDRSKKAFNLPYQELRKKKAELSKTHLIKTKKHTYEALNYTLELLEESTMSYFLDTVPTDTSDWANFVEEFLIGKVEETPAKKEVLAEGEEEKWVRPETSPEAKLLAFTLVVNSMLDCSKAQKDASKLLLERFKKRIQADRQLVRDRVAEINKKAEKKVRGLQKKINTFKRMKQFESVEIYERDIKRFQAGVKHHIKEVVEYAQQEFIQQKKRIKGLFAVLAQKNQGEVKNGIEPLMQLANHLSVDEDFTKEYTEFIIKDLDTNYHQELGLFYDNLADILHPDLETKMKLCKALEKHGHEVNENLKLTAEEEEGMMGKTNEMKEKLTAGRADLWECKLILQATLIPVSELLDLSLDSKSLYTLLQLKMTSPTNPKAATLPKELVKEFLDLNKAVNPAPQYQIILPGQDKTPDPVKKINQPLLNKLLLAVHV